MTLAQELRRDDVEAPVAPGRGPASGEAAARAAVVALDASGVAA